MDNSHENLYRICNPTHETAFFETENNQFTGIYGPLFMKLIYLANKNHNLSHFINDDCPGVGEKISNSESYDGCIGRLQRGEADIMTRTFDYPINVVNLTHGHVLYDEIITIVGAFTKPKSDKIADFGRCIMAFDWSVYTMIASFLISITILLHLQNKWQKVLFKGKKKYFFWKFKQFRTRKRFRIIKISLSLVIRHFLKSYYIIATTLFTRYCIMMVTILSIVTFTYFNSVMSTDYALHGEVKIYTSYNQLINSTVKPLFILGDEDMKNLPDFSPGKTFWNWAVKTYGEDEIRVSFSGKLAKIAGQSIDVISGESVILVGEFVASFIKKSACALFGRSVEELFSKAVSLTGEKFVYKSEYEDAQIYLRTDSSAVRETKAIPFSESAVQLFPIFDKIYRTFSEHGIFAHFTREILQIEYLTVEPFSAMAPKLLPSKYQVRKICEESNGLYKPTQVKQLVPSNYKYSSLTFSCIVITSFFVIIFEIILHKFTRSIKIYPKKRLTRARRRTLRIKYC